MMHNKSINTFPDNVVADKLWPNNPASYANKENALNNELSIKNIKGFIKLVLGIIYFMSLVFALTILLT